MALIETWLKQDLDQMVPVQRLDGNIFSGDNKGNLVGVEVYRGKSGVTLLGVCIGYFMRADGTTILLDGELDRNKAWVVLNNSCYAVAGQFSLVLKNGATTIAACTGRVYRSSTDAIEEGESTLATIEDLLAQLDKIAFAEREIDPVLSGPDSNGRWIVGAELKKGHKYKIHDTAQGASTLPAGASPYMYNPGGSRVIAMEEIGDDDAFYFDGLEFTYGKSTGSSADSSSGSSGSGSGSGGDEEVVVVEEDVVPADEEVVPAEEEETDPVDSAYFSEITAAWAATIYFTERTNVLDFWQDVARSVSKEFYPEKSYQAGEYCYRKGRFYRFLYDHEGAWAPGDVEDATVGDGLFRNDLAMTLYARNISNVEQRAEEIEGEWYDYKENVDASVATIDDMESSLTDLEDIIESLGLSRVARLNRPNLLKQNYWLTRKMPTSEVIYNTHNITYAAISKGTITYTIEDSRITTGHAVLQLQSRIYAIVHPENVTVTFAAGVATVTVANRTRTEDEIAIATQEVSTDIRLWLSTVGDKKVPYGEGSRWYGSGTPYLNSTTNGQYPGDADGDSIGEIVVDLAEADQITEPDGEVYDKAIQYNVTANTAWGNADWMVFNYQGYETTWDTSKTEPKDYGNIPEMIPGEKYTMSCWARMVTGEKAWVSFAYGGKYGNSPYSETSYTDHSGIRSAPVEVTGTEWKRISWTFVFEGMTGNQYTYTNGTRTDEATGDTINTITRTKNWTKRVQFGVHRKYTGVLQLCGFRLVAGGLLLPTKYDTAIRMIEEISERVDDLEEMIVNNGGN